MKKYELTEETKQVAGRTLHRIKALIDFNNISAGDLSGWVESENNLSHYSNSWIFNEAMVYSNAMVSGNAFVSGSAKVYDDADVYDEACVRDAAQIYGKAQVSDIAFVVGSAQVFGNACVYENAVVCDEAKIYGNAEVFGNARVCKQAQIYEHASVFDYAEVDEDTKVHGDADVNSNAQLNGGEITRTSDYIVFKNWWTNGRSFTWTRSNNMWADGLFYGTSEQLLKKAYKESQKNGREYERAVKYVESIISEENE